MVKREVDADTQELHEKIKKLSTMNKLLGVLQEKFEEYKNSNESNEEGLQTFLGQLQELKEKIEDEGGSYTEDDGTKPKQFDFSS